MIKVTTTAFREYVHQSNPDIYTLKTFADGEISAEFNESIRNEKICIIGSIQPSHENLMEIIMLSDAARRAGADEIVLITSYLGWSRQDRRGGKRVNHGGRAIANMLEGAGITRIVTLDVHAAQIDGCYNIPFDNIGIDSVFGHTIENLKDTLDNICICSPDQGGIKRAEVLNKGRWPSVFCLKERKEANIVSKMELIGNVKGKNVIIVDDILDTGGTLCKAAELIIENGALSVRAMITHGLFNGKAIELINNSVIKKVYVSNSISKTNTIVNDKIEVVKIENMLADILQSIEFDQSLKMTLKED